VFAFEQQAQRGEHVSLIISDENPWAWFLVRTPPACSTGAALG
jgi:hypothetical protein